ncbi:DgyrCDS7269 [Dimorphilus gyrociliatus]|uniref:Bis(5'-nucleosyl)-tetraphosphatase [asymmetrical] n=1 Tax=Dimorphilus gyrociliatus TaxID=2664684 RepID=A0A7I8VRH6_9ANNE|nr:DgyrCDS7269 [Dimorphilus gyrociliatus]
MIRRIILLLSLLYHPLCVTIKCYACGNEFKSLWENSSVLDLKDCPINSTANFNEICEAEICVKSLYLYQNKRELSNDNELVEIDNEGFTVRYCAFQLHRPDFQLDERGEAIIMEEKKMTSFMERSREIKIFSAGMIIYRDIDNKREYLVLQHMNPRNWTPPKGRMEGSEDEKMTAIREVFEETGLTEKKYNFIENYKKATQYNTRKGFKQATFFLARLKNPLEPIVLRPSEHQSFGWISLTNNDGIQNKLQSNLNLLNLLKDANDYITMHNL